MTLGRLSNLLAVSTCALLAAASCQSNSQETAAADSAVAPSADTLRSAASSAATSSSDTLGNATPGPTADAAAPAWEAQVRQRAAAVEKKLIGWRRDIHEHPELGEQETRTAKLVAEHLRSLGLEVRTEVGRTGVVGILKGGQPGRMVALRADMDALPVHKKTGLPFASKATMKKKGATVPVMHACGHDTHTAILMATAEVLAGMKDQLPSSVMFIFQPAEEGSSLVDPGQGKSWGAKRMLEEGLFKQQKPAAVFGLHVLPGKSGQVFYRSGPTLSGGDELKISVAGEQGHGGMPWNTVDPITTAAYIITNLQTVVSRRANLTASPAAVSVGIISGGSSSNVIPDSTFIGGTIRLYDKQVREQVVGDIKLIATRVAEAAHAKASVTITSLYPVTVNNKALAEQMHPVLNRAADGNLIASPLQGASEDFAYYAQATPGLFIFLGITPKDQDPAQAAPNHSPLFMVDESALVVGVRAMSSLAMAFLTGQPAQGSPAAPAK